MIDRLARNPGSLYLLLAAYFALNAVLRIAGPASLEIDEAEQLFFAQHLAIGYDTQPPFYNWLQYGVLQLLGNSVAALTLLKNTMLFLSYVLFGLTAHLVIRDRVLAVIATLGLITLPQIGYEAQRDLTHTVSLLFAACLFMYFLVRALLRPTAVNYAVVGLAIGIGLLSKYNFLLLPVATVLALALDRDFRTRLFDPRILLTILVAGVIVTPHALWFLDHVREATGLTVQKMNRGFGGEGTDWIGVAALIKATAAITALTFAVFAVAFGKTFLRAWSAESRWTRLLGRILMLTLLFVLVLVLSGEANYIRHRWLVPVFFLLPLYLAAKLDALGEAAPGASRKFGVVVAAIMIIVPAILFARPIVQGAMRDYAKQNVPYGAATVGILASSPDRPSIILASDMQLAGNLALHAPGIAITLPGYGHLEEPFVLDASHPVLAVWREGDVPTKGMLNWLDRKAGLAGGPIASRDIAVPYHHGQPGDVHHFRYAWIYPAAEPQPGQ